MKLLSCEQLSADGGIRRKGNLGGGGKKKGNLPHKMPASCTCVEGAPFAEL